MSTRPAHDNGNDDDDEEGVAEEEEGWDEDGREEEDDGVDAAKTEESTDGVCGGGMCDDEWAARGRAGEGEMEESIAPLIMR